MSAQIVMYTDSYDSERRSGSAVGAKPETMNELSCQLPSEANDRADDSPIPVHTDVLESVFSLNLDNFDLAVTETPMFDELDFAIDGVKVNSKDDWVSLFTHEEEEGAPRVPDEALDDLLGDDFKESFDFVPAPAKPEPFVPAVTMLPTPVMRDEFKSERSGPMKRKSSVDHLGCVSYSKKQRSRPLMPVEANAEDPVSVKRARNTEAARRSRARKMERMGQLEQKVEELLGSREELASELDRLKKILQAHNIDY